MIGLIAFVGAVLAQPVAAKTSDKQWAITQRHDDEVRARNAAHDFFFVSTVELGLSQMRFYIDRNTVKGTDASGKGRAWVDAYEVVDHKKPIRLRHVKFLAEVRCNDDSPQTRFGMSVTYEPDGSAKSESGTGSWVDVVPGSSMETQHRFMCNSEPANAYYPVFNGNTPEKDAMAYFSRQSR